MLKVAIMYSVDPRDLYLKLEGGRINKFVTGDRNDGRHSSCIFQLATHFPDPRLRNPETRETRKFRICERPNPGYELHKLFATRKTQSSHKYLRIFSKYF
jgi:hypothetical protein